MSGDVRRWPLFLIAAPAAVAVWSGWVGLGALCGFGVVHPLPGIADGFRLNTAITLPVGVEAYGAYALGAWLTPGTSGTARRFARASALGSLALGMAGQVIYHLLAAAHEHRAPWPVVVLVACLPVITLGCGAGLTHLIRAGHDDLAEPADEATPGQVPADAIAADADPVAAVLADQYPDMTTGDLAVAGFLLRTDRDNGEEAAGSVAARPAITAATTPVTDPATARTARPVPTATAVARLAARHPDMKTGDMARRLHVSERTVRRYLEPSRRAVPVPEHARKAA